MDQSATSRTTSHNEASDKIHNEGSDNKASAAAGPDAAASTPMPMRQALGPHLPFLRRFARALTGSQHSGDSYVRATLEALLADPTSLTDPEQSRRSLYQLFHRIWAPNGTISAEDLGREALLLTAVEGFDPADAAIITGADVDAVTEAIASARASIAAAIRSRVLVIEDEPIILMHLEQIVEDMGHEVAATAITRDEAVEAARRSRPDLVLADIQLADGSSGIDAVNDILASFDVPVIFITAYPERLLTGERPEPTYLVTKPFEPDTIIATVGEALLRREYLAGAA